MKKNAVFMVSCALVFLLFSNVLFSKTYSASDYIITYPDTWSHVYSDNTLSLLVEEDVNIDLTSSSVKDISDRINKLKKADGKFQPTNLLDVLSYDVVDNAVLDGWVLVGNPKSKNLGVFKTLYAEMSKGIAKKAYYIFEKDHVFTVELTTDDMMEFGSYQQKVEDIITSGFSVKAGNPIVMVIGMTIAYVASFIGLMAAYLYYRKREGGTL